jgi:transcriptional regulator with XRE-family HTH domain
MFSEQLRSVRLAKGLTQAELAVRCGLHPNAIAQFECGGREPSLKNLVKLADGLGVTIDALVNGKK